MCLVTSEPTRRMTAAYRLRIRQMIRHAVSTSPGGRGLGALRVALSSLLMAFSLGAPSTRSVHAQPAHPKRLALLVGISDYDKGTNEDDGFGRLSTGPDLASMMHALAVFDKTRPWDVVTLQDSKATQQNIIATFHQHLISRARPGDTVLFYYTGHGHWVRAQNDPTELDGLDEVLVTWVPTQQQQLPLEKRHQVMYLIDDTIHDLLQQLSNKMLDPGTGKVRGNITVILDSCHSGNASKGSLIPKGRAYIPKIDGPLPPQAMGKGQPGMVGGEKGQASGWIDHRPPDEVVFISGCQSGQRSYMMHESAKGSVLTYYLSQGLEQLSRQRLNRLSYRQLFEWVSVKTLAENAEQQPQLEGNIDAPLFGDGKVPGTSGYQEVLGAKKVNGVTTLTLDAGFLYGVTRGSEYRIVRSEVTGASAKIADAEITQVAYGQSTAKVTREYVTALQPTDYQAARALETNHRFDGQPLRVLIKSPKTPVTDPMHLQKDQVAAQRGSEIEAKLHQENYWTRAGVDESNFDVRIGYENGAYFYQLASGRKTAVPEPLDATQLASLQKRLLGLWRWKRLADLTAPWPSQVKCEVRPLVPGGRIKTTGGGVTLLQPGDTAKLVCTNSSGGPLFVTAIYLQSNGEIQVFPKNPLAQQAVPGDGTPHQLFTIDDVEALEGKELEAMKVIATKDQRDFSGLALGKGARPPAKGPVDPVLDMLYGIVDGDSKGVRISSNPIAPSWFVTGVRWEIRPR
jgi:hypothetical protein